MLERNLNLIRKIVWSYVRRNPGLEFDDLFSEACLSVLEKQHKFNPNKGKESTFIWHLVDNHLKTLLSQEAVRNETVHCMEEVETNDVEPGPEQQLAARERFTYLISSLSPEAQAVCSLTLKNQDIYLPTDKPKKCRGEIMRVLKEQGWSWSQIWGSFAELKQILSEEPI